MVKHKREKTVIELKWRDMTDSQRIKAREKFNPSNKDKDIESFGFSDSGNITWMTARQVVTP